jgi:hypothetical protein
MIIWTASQRQQKVIAILIDIGPIAVIFISLNGEM